MRKRYKFPLTMIFMAIIGCIVVFTCYYLYTEVSSGATIVVDAPISVNYISDYNLSKNNSKNIQFSVSNNGSEEVFYYIEFIGVETSDVTNYHISSDSDIDLTGTVKSEKIIDSISIKPGVTQNYTLNINSDNNKYFNAELSVKKVVEEIQYFGDLIKNHNEIKAESITNVAIENSILDEGLISSNDDLGKVYYFRGDVSNNYVSFADMTWRAVRINSDNSVRLILNDDIGSVSAYYLADSQYGFLSSTIYETLIKWYESNLNNYADTISNQKYCNDNSVVGENVFAAYNRANVDKIATFSCLGEESSLKIGLLTVDEAMFAGLTTENDSSSSYLINDNLSEDFYLMSGAKISSSYYPFLVSENGKIISSTIGTYLRGVRPVINIASGIKATGNGTVDNPYIIEVL